MIRCEKCKDQLADYIDGALNAEAQQAFEAHITACPDCRRELAQFREFDARLRQDVPPMWEPVKPSPQFISHLKNTIPEPSPKPTLGIIEWFASLWNNHRTVMATGLSICLVMALMISGVFEFNGDDDDDETAISHELSVNEDYPATMTAPTATQAAESVLSMEGSGIAKSDPADASLSERDPVSQDGPDGATLEPTDDDRIECASDALYDTNRQANTILGYTSSEVETAVQIALANPTFGESLNTRGFERIEVSNSLSTADFGCDALTVIIIREDTQIHTCIDTDTGKVTASAVYPYHPQ